MSDLVTYSRKRKRKADLNEEDEDRHLKEWDKSHEEFFFPGVPVFILNELQQQLGFETVASPRKRLKGGVESIVEGQRFPVEQYLTLDDDPEGQYLVRKDGTTLVSVDSLKNKHVLLCCFYVPLSGAGFAVPHARSLSSLCSELATSKFAKEECEMVIVAKMAPHLADNKAAFNNFFKAFPDSCLTVPFHHKKRIDRICESLNLRSFNPPSLLVNHNRNVLRTDLEQVWSYGVEGFPFSNERLKAIEEDDKRLMSGSCRRPLATLLGLDQLPSDHRLRDAVTGEERMPISELENKDVGLYLCCKGDLLDSLSEIYRYCKKKESGFEIVVVWFPGLTGLGKSEFELLMTSAFRLRGLSCLALPVNDDSVVRRLFRICGDMTHSTMSDKLLTMGADDIIQGVIKSNQSQISREPLQAKFEGKQVFMYRTAVENDRPWSRWKETKGGHVRTHASGHQETHSGSAGASESAPSSSPPFKQREGKEKVDDLGDFGQKIDIGKGKEKVSEDSDELPLLFIHCLRYVKSYYFAHTSKGLGGKWLPDELLGLKHQTRRQLMKYLNGQYFTFHGLWEAISAFLGLSKAHLPHIPQILAEDLDLSKDLLRKLEWSMPDLLDLRRRICNHIIGHEWEEHGNKQNTFDPTEYFTTIDDFYTRYIDQMNHEFNEFLQSLPPAKSDDKYKLYHYMEPNRKNDDPHNSTDSAAFQRIRLGDLIGFFNGYFGQPVQISVREADGVHFLHEIRILVDENRNIRSFRDFYLKDDTIQFYNCERPRYKKFKELRNLMVFV